MKASYHNSKLKKIEKNMATIEIILPEGKTTPEGEYPKLKDDNSCIFPERASCNYGLFFERCPFMKYDNSLNCWRCICGNKQTETK